MKKVLFISLIILPICVLVFFMLPDRSDTVDTENLWQGTWSSDKTGAKGDFEFDFQQIGTDFSGNIRISGSSITKGGNISGTIRGDVIEFGFARDKRGEIRYVGTISDNTMTGTWEIPVIKDRGVWQARKE